MTFTEIVTTIANRTNITAASGLTLIGTFVNDRYRELMSGVGLVSTIRTTATANTNTTDRTVTFTCEKIFSVFDPAFTPLRVLDERTFDYLRNQFLGSDPVQEYAVQTSGASTVTIFLGGQPASIYALNADVEVNLLDLSGANVPAFPADFHDILIRGGLADQLYKMEKYDLSTRQEQKFEKRLSELRYFLAKSAYLDIYQGARSRGRSTTGLV